MRTQNRSIEQIIEEQVRKWQFSRTEPKTETPFRPIVTISREPGSGGSVAAATRVGELVAQRAKDAGITNVVFDRGGFAYHGRIAAIADAAREAGLEF